jgi:hypothetical protein
MRPHVALLGLACVASLEAGRAVASVPSFDHRQESCRYEGRVVDYGTVLCLRVNGIEQLARCEMRVNNPSWHILQQGCPVAAGRTTLPR